MKRTMYSVVMYVVIPVVLGLLTLITMRLTGFSVKQSADIAVNVVWLSVVGVFLIRVMA
jgi:hypothetical protein